MPQVRSERTGWRDENLSQRHRRWGWNCPAVDLDFLFLEYDKGKATAVVEYKHERAAPQYRTHPTYQAIINLCDRARLPCIGCRYAGDFSWFRVSALNDMAKPWIPDANTEMTEMEWIKLLYRIRGYEPPADLFNDMDLVV